MQPRRIAVGQYAHHQVERRQARIRCRDTVIGELQQRCLRRAFQ
jgi:hypothetical protein